MDLTGLYLKDIGKTDLLDASGEVRLARDIGAGIEAERALASGTVHSPRERVRLNGVASRGRRAREEMAAANVRLVVAMARRYQGRGVDLADLIQEGNVGLMRAVERFDWQRGFRFSTYATWWIRQAITRALDDAASPVHVPQPLLADGRIAARARAALEVVDGHTPTTEEVARAAGLAPERVEATTSYPLSAVSLSAPVGDDDSELGDLLVDREAPSPEAVAAHHEIGLAVRSLVDTLPPRPAAVLRLRFGMDGEGPFTYEEVGRRLGISRERVRQLERRALSRLRQDVAGALDVLGDVA